MPPKNPAPTEQKRLPTAAESRARSITACGTELKEALDAALAEIGARADAKLFNAGVQDARGLREALEHLGYKVAAQVMLGQLRVRW